MYAFFRPLLFRLAPERAHTATMRAAGVGQRVARGALEKQFGWESERLATRLWGLDFPNPVGLAAGFDKNGRHVPFWETLGFGFVEIGSVTAQPSRGNPRPRLFRLPDDEALVNRMGLNNEGAVRVARRLRLLRHARPLGVNIAKTHSADVMGEKALEDFRASFARLAPLADYVALNISCPNTAEGKTFEEPEALEALLQTIAAERGKLTAPPPVLLKLAPPLSTRFVLDSLVDETVALARQYGVDGFIAANTAPDRDGLATDAARIAEVGRGGLSGAPLEARSTRLVEYLYGRTDGRVPIVGLGGVRSAETAYRKIRAGASLVQLYTGLVYGGPGLVRSIKTGLVALLDRDGLDTIADAVGQG